MTNFRHMALAALLATAAGTAQAQTNYMVVHLNNGTTQRVKASDIDHVEFTTTNTPSTEKPVTLNVTETHPLYARYTSSAPTSLGTYLVMYDQKSVFSGYRTDDEVVAADLKLMEQAAAQYGMTREEFLKAYLETGDSQTTMLITGIVPNRAYTLWGYGMTEAGERTSGITTLEFTTPAVTYIDNTIAIDINTNSDGYPQATFTPDDETLPFMSGYVPATATDQEIEDAMNASISNGIGNYFMYNMTIDDFLEQQCDKGVSDQAFSSSTSGTKYYAVAAFLNSEGAVCSKIFKKEFTGGAVSTTSTAPSTLSLQAPKCRAFSLTPATPRLVKVPAVKR